MPKLSQETDLKNACAVVFEGKYYLAVNGHIYVADGSLTEENGDPAWFFWVNVPAQCLAVLNGHLWFGTADGRLCRFANSEEEHAYLDDTAAIAAYWRTPTLPLSDWSRFKTVRDVIPTLMPHSRSGATVQYENETVSSLRFPAIWTCFPPHTGFSRFSFPVHSGCGDVPYPLEAAPQSAVCRAHRQRPAG